VSDQEKEAANRAARRAKKEAWLRAIYDRHLGQFRAAGNMAPATIARHTHLALDALLELDRENGAGSENIQCGRGCNHCCHEAVEIWPQEAALLAETVHEAGIELDHAGLERQSRYTVDNWRQHSRADRACVFLGGDGACRVYESRPNACRKLLVVSDPVLCDADLGQSEDVNRWFSWEVFGAELLPSSLLKALGRL
jgi:hypothetical protein